MKKYAWIVYFLLATSFSTFAEDGYNLWLNYKPVTDQKKLKSYQQRIQTFTVLGNSETLDIVRAEFNEALPKLLSKRFTESRPFSNQSVVVTSLRHASAYPALKLEGRLQNINDEGFIISTTTIGGRKVILIAGRTDVGALYGVFHFLRMMQQYEPIENLSVETAPKIKLRILNHWDNLDRTVERGYAGFSLWDWQKLPDYIDPRYTDYARANASIGINGTVLTNVNANALILRPDYLEKVATLANLFRPYGIKVYLTARFSAPIELGGLATADPLDEGVRQWWKNKAAEIYKVIPDFGGFLVKANSEGQPGPQNYKRSHADGANMLADAVAPFHGIVIWRAFVYDNNVPDDRVKQAFSEFKPLDGKFRDNVLVQVKNGPLDFQPREPFHPMFGAMPKTPLMMEFQLTQEYLGFSTHLVFLPVLFKEVLESDTYAKGKGTTVAKVIDGSADQHVLSGISGVANIGTDRNWCGHPFAQSNWYGFGRLAWDYNLSSEKIADEWVRATFTNADTAVRAIKNMMLASHETVVNYMTPLGLHHIMGWSHHYGPGPWVNNKLRADWTAVYYHKADTLGVGFNRTASGSNALSQYAPEVQKQFESLETCPEKLLLWFHHVPWNHRMKSGRNLWEEMSYRYASGVDSVRSMQRTWNMLEDAIDPELFNQVRMLLIIQKKEAVLWRNSCLLYFQQFSGLPIPKELEQPDHSLEYYEKLTFPYAPGIRPGW